MSTDDAHYLQRRARVLSVATHPSEVALMVHYRLEATVLGELGDPMMADKKECEKIIRLRSLSAATNASQLARDVIERSQLLSPAHHSRVQALIVQLQRRQQRDVTGTARCKPTSGVRQGSASSTASSSSSSMASSLSLRSSGGTAAVADGGGGGGTAAAAAAGGCGGAAAGGEQWVDNGGDGSGGASLAQCDAYVELLYEEMDEKRRGAARLLQLARQSHNLLALSGNEMVLEVVSRTLREEWRKSVQLTTDIVHFYACFAAYSGFHHIIAKYKIGSLTMDIMQWCLTRGQWGDGAHVTQVTGDTHLSEVSTGRLTPCAPADPHCDQLLRVCVQLLLHLAEDVATEHKMQRRGVVTILAHCLCHNFSCHLHLLTVTMLKKLSMYRESVEDMAAVNIVAKLAALLFATNTDVPPAPQSPPPPSPPPPPPPLLSMSLRLLYNLSFDASHRRHIAAATPSLLGKLTQLLPDSSVQRYVCGVLYHIVGSIPVECAATPAVHQQEQLQLVVQQLVEADCATVCVQLLLNWFQETVGPLLASLCIALSAHRPLARQLCDTVGVRAVLARATGRRDQLPAQLLAVTSCHVTSDVTIAASFVEVVGDISAFVVQQQHQQPEQQQLLAQLVAVMANLQLPSLDWAELFRQHQLPAWLQHILSDTELPDNNRQLVFWLLKLVATAAASTDGTCCLALAEHGIFNLLTDMLTDRQSDDELVLSAVFVLHQACCHRQMRQLLVTNTPDCVDRLLDLLHSSHALIRAICDKTLDLLSRVDEALLARLIATRFARHNSRWLQLIESGAASSPGDHSPADHCLADIVPCLHSHEELSISLPSDTSSEVSFEN